MRPRRTVTIFGSSRPVPDSPAYQAAYELGRTVAEAGWAVCNGGYGGTMEASARGAREAGGHTIGVTCAALGRRGGPNRFICEEVTTLDLFVRIQELIRRGDAYVILPGGTGTLAELGLVWELVSKRMVLRPLPPILLGDYWWGVVQSVHELGDGVAPIVVASPSDAINRIRAAWAGDEYPSVTA